jgi:hypothetical protein
MGEFFSALYTVHRSQRYHQDTRMTEHLINIDDACLKVVTSAEGVVVTVARTRPMALREQLRMLPKPRVTKGLHNKKDARPRKGQLKSRTRTTYRKKK